MNAPRKGLLKTVSILFIVFGAILAVYDVIYSLSLHDRFVYYLSFRVTMAYSLLLNIFDLVIGILGVKKAGDPTKAKFFITTGIILCAIYLILIIIRIVNGRSWELTHLFYLVLAILYIVGGSLNKKAL